MRSLLFVPADSERKLAKGRESEADALILDLEDSVAAERGSEARRIAREFLAAAGNGRQRRYVRINPLVDDTPLADLAAVMPAKPDGIMLPKATPDGVRVLGHHLAAFEATAGSAIGSTRIVAIVTETPAAMFELGGYRGSSPRLEALTWGAEDLAAVIGCANRTPEGEYDDVFRLARSLCVLAASAAEVIAIDTVFTDFKDERGLEAECAATRRMGFTAKMAIHPAQVAAINRAFSVSADEIGWARKVVDAFAANPGTGTIGIDGKMIDRPHLVLAQRILARGGAKR